MLECWHANSSVRDRLGKEDVEYVESIEEDVRWLGFEWAGLYFASDYFEQLYGYAVVLIEKGLAYVDSQSSDEIRRTRAVVPGLRVVLQVPTDGRHLLARGLARLLRDFRPGIERM